MKRENAFTLVELLVVIAIIGILLGLLMVAAGLATQDARRDEAKTMIKAVYFGIENFRMNNSDQYPTTREDGLMKTDPGQLLYRDIEDKPNMGNSLVGEFSPKYSRINDDGVYCDPWGEPIRFKRKDANVERGEDGVKTAIVGEINGSSVSPDEKDKQIRSLPIHPIWVYSAGSSSNATNSSPFLNEWFDSEDDTVIPIFNFRQ